MNTQLEGIWKRMLNLGLGALAHANRHAAYCCMENERWSDLSVLQAAHAAEILIKARISQEHPLLIFDRLPAISDDELSLNDLFEKGKTVEWSELPTRLWATAGINIPELTVYKEFGRLRNGIQHFMPSFVSESASVKTLKFIFSVIDPFINNCWGLYAIDYDEDYDPYLYFAPCLIRNNITFLVSKDAANSSEDWDIDWAEVDPSYRKEMQRRIDVAKLG